MVRLLLDGWTKSQERFLHTIPSGRGLYFFWVQLNLCIVDTIGTKRKVSSIGRCPLGGSGTFQVQEVEKVGLTLINVLNVAARNK